MIKAANVTDFQVNAVAGMLDDLLGNAEDLAKISDLLWSVGLTKLAAEISEIAESNRDTLRTAHEILSARNDEPAQSAAANEQTEARV